MSKKNDNTPKVVRDSVNGQMLYARIFIRNNYPLPQPETHPIEAIFLLLRHAGFMLENYLEFGDTQQVVEARQNIVDALNRFKEFEIVHEEELDVEETFEQPINQETDEPEYFDNLPQLINNQ